MTQLVQQFQWAAPPLFRRICRLYGQLTEDFRYFHSIPSIVEILSKLAPSVVKDSKASVKFFRDILLPFHKCDNYGLYHAKLASMVVHVIRVEKLLLGDFVHFITRHWPVRSREKSSLVFDEISHVCEAFPAGFDTGMAVSLISKISTFFSDPAAEVSQQSLFLLGSPTMKPILKLCPQRMLRELYTGASAARTTHWLPDTRHFAADFLGELVALDAGLAASPLAQEERESDVRAEIWRWILGKPPE
jgi:hypothetical protein